MSCTRQSPSLVSKSVSHRQTLALMSETCHLMIACTVTHAWQHSCQGQINFVKDCTVACVERASILRIMAPRTLIWVRSMLTWDSAIAHVSQGKYLAQDGEPTKAVEQVQAQQSQTQFVDDLTVAHASQGKYLSKDGGPKEARLNKYKGRYAEAEARYGLRPNVGAATRAYADLARQSGMTPTALALR